MAAIATRHAAFFHLQGKGTAIRAGLLRHHRAGIGFQPQALARDKLDGDQMLFDHPANRRQNRRDIAPLHPGPAARIKGVTVPT